MNAIATAFDASSSPFPTPSLVPIPETQRPATARRRTHQHEEANDYARVVVALNSRWRVSVSGDGGIQWLLQYRRGRRGGFPIWRNHSYCLTRDGLLRCAAEHVGPADAFALEIISDLPEHIRKSQQ